MEIRCERDIRCALAITDDVKLGIHILTLTKHFYSHDWHKGIMFIVYPPNIKLHIETYKIKWNQIVWSIDVNSGKLWEVQDAREEYKMFLDDDWEKLDVGNMEQRYSHGS